MKKSQDVKIIEVTMQRKIPLTEKICPQCGAHFMGMKLKQFCSTACAKKAAYHRNPEAYRESRMRSYYKQKEHASKE